MNEGPGVRTARRRTPACTMTVCGPTQRNSLVATLKVMALLPVCHHAAMRIFSCNARARYGPASAFSDDQLETQQNGSADRRLHIQIQNTKRAVMDHPSGEVLLVRHNASCRA